MSYFPFIVKEKKKERKKHLKQLRELSLKAFNLLLADHNDCHDDNDAGSVTANDDVGQIDTFIQ